MTSWKILSESVSFENIENVAITYLVDDVSILQSCEKHVSFTVKFEYVMIFRSDWNKKLSNFGILDKTRKAIGFKSLRLNCLDITQVNIKMRNVEMVKHTQAICWQIANELFECVWPFYGIGA